MTFAFNVFKNYYLTSFFKHSIAHFTVSCTLDPFRAVWISLKKTFANDLNNRDLRDLKTSKTLHLELTRYDSLFAHVYSSL